MEVLNKDCASMTGQLTDNYFLGLRMSLALLKAAKQLSSGLP
jgi:hypothetical protein